MFDPKAHLIHLPRRVKDKATGQYVTVVDDYLEVRRRVLMFREKYPHGVITTEEVCVDLERGYARYKATVEDGEGGRATGYGTETKADFPDYCERAETRALGRALALLGFGTQFVGQDLTEGDHVADAPVAQPNGQVGENPVQLVGQGLNGHGRLPPEARLTPDQARELKRLAQHAFGDYQAGEAQLRHDLGFEPDEKLTLRHIAAHVPVERYEQLRATYEARLQAAVEADVP
jgi:hypothetical protein